MVERRSLRSAPTGLSNLRVEEGVGIVGFDQAALADFEEAGGHGAREEAVVAHEDAGDIALLQLLLEVFLALDVEMVGRLVQHVEVRPQQLHLEEHQPRALAMAQHPDRLLQPHEREARAGEVANRLLLGHALGRGHVIQDLRPDRQSAHRLVEIDQAAGRVEAHGSLSVIVLAVGFVGCGQRGQQGRLAGAVGAEQGDALAGGNGQPIDGDQLAPRSRHRDVEVGQAQRHLGIDVAVGQFEPAFARDIGLRALLLDAGDAALDGVLALVEVGVLDRPDLVARRRLLQPLDLALFLPGPRGRRRVAAQQLLAGDGEARLEGVYAVGAQEERALGHAVEELAVVADDQHRDGELVRQPAFQRVDVGEVEMVGRLVEDQDVRLLEPCRRRDQHQPLPAARQRAERLVESFRIDADFVDQHVDPPVFAVLSDLGQRLCQHLTHREGGQPFRHVLRHLADPKPARADHLAGIEFERAGQALQQGGLAGAVLADQRGARLVEQERDLLEDAARAVEEGGLLHAEHGLTRRHRLS